MINCSANKENGEHQEMNFANFDEFTDWWRDHCGEYIGFNATNSGGVQEDRVATSEQEVRNEL